MIGVVQAIFLVNKAALGSRKMPESWLDILSKEFENSISIPIADFDLFNSILVHIYKLYGQEGVTKLGKSLLSNLHPAQDRKSTRLNSSHANISYAVFCLKKKKYP